MGMNGADYSNLAVGRPPAWYPRSMRALGIDLGRKRVGLALSDATGLLARPWKTVDAPAGLRALVAALAHEVSTLERESDGLAAVVVGYPRRLSGEPNAQTSFVESVAAALRPLIGAAVVLQDERLTSHEADALLSRREKDWRKRKPMLDAAAAAVILQDYLDSCPRDTAAPGEPVV